MAEFDDLVPTITAGEFDDLIPSGGGEFDDLIPKHDAKESWKWGEPFRPGYGTEVARGLTQPVPGMVKTASIIGEELLDRPAFGVGPSGRDILRKIGVDTQPDAVPESRPLYKLGEWMQDKIDAGYPAMPEPERNLGHDVASGLGQVASMVTGGVAAKAAGATLKGAALVGTALGFGQEFDDAFTRARQRGDDPDTAFAKSFGYATVASLIENKLGAGRIIRKYFPDPAEAAKKLSAWGISKATAISLAVGFGEEGSQRFAQNWIVEGKPSLEGIVQEGAPGGIVQAIAELPAHLLRGRGKIRRAPISRLTPPLITEQQEIENAQIETPVEMGETQPPRSIQGVAARVASEIPQPAVAPPAKEAAGAGVTAEVTPIPPPAPRQLLGGSLFTDTMLRQEYRELRKRLGGGIEYIENPVTRENAIHNLESQDPNRAKAARRYVELHDAISELAPQAPATPTIKPAPIDTSLIASVVLPKIAPVVFKSLDPMNPAIGWFELTSPFTVPETGRVIQPGPGAMLNSSQIEKYGMSLEGPAKTAFEEAKKRPSVNAQRSPAGVGVPAPVSGGTAPAPVGKGEFQSAIRVRGKTYTGQAHALALVKAENEIGSIDQSEIELGWLKGSAWHDIEKNPEGSPGYKPYSQAERMGTKPETKPVAPVGKTPVQELRDRLLAAKDVAELETIMESGNDVLNSVSPNDRQWLLEASDIRGRELTKNIKLVAPVAKPKPVTARAPITRLPTPTPATPIVETSGGIKPAEDLGSTMIGAGKKSIEGLRGRISNVKYGNIENNEITFDLDGKPHTGTLKGRNRDLILGSSPEADAGVATRVFVDGDAKPASQVEEKIQRVFVVATNSYRQVQRLERSVSVATGGLPVSLGSKARTWEIPDTPKNRAAVAKLGFTIRTQDTKRVNERREKSRRLSQEYATEIAADVSQKPAQAISQDNALALAAQRKSEGKSQLAVTRELSEAGLSDADATGISAQVFKETKAETPVAAVEKVKEVIHQIKFPKSRDETLSARATAIRSTKAKAIKTELIQRLEKALEDSPANTEFDSIRGTPTTDKAKKADSTVTINIPEDGDFTLLNRKENIAGILAQAKRISTTAGTPPKPGTSKAIGNLSEQADAAAKAYGSAENAYRSTRRQRDELQSQGPPANSEDRNIWNDQIENADALLGELYGQTKAGTLEVQAEAARDRVATYKEGAKGFESEIARLEAIKRKNFAHTERLADLKERYAKNQDFIKTNERNAGEWEQQSAKEKAALESTPTEPTPPETGEAAAKLVTVKSPSDTEAIRATLPDGIERVIPLAEFEANPITDATKLEPVARDRRGDWQPVKGEVKLTEQQPENPHTSPESEENSERARKLKVEERTVQTEQEALDEINRKRESNGEKPLASANLEHGVSGYYFDGVIYYILDGIHSPEQFLAVQREEIAHHINSSPEAKKVLAELGRAPEFELERREIRGSYPKVESETADAYSERIANEMLAKSRVQDRGLFQRMMDWLIEKLSNLPRFGDWIRDSAENRQAILRTISRRLEANFTAAGKTDVPLAAMANTQVQGAPVGIEREQENIEAIQKIIRADIFDGTQLITEAATEDARTLFNRLTDPAGKSAATGEILSKTNAQMGPGLVLAELWRYAEGMVINNSDDWLLRQIVPRYQDFDLGGGGPTAYGRGLRALQETDTLFRQLLEIQREKHKAAGDKMSVGQELLNELIEALRTVTPDAAEIEADFDATAGVKPPKGLKSLIESIRTSPYADQSDPAWRRETAIQWFLSAGLSREQAELAAVKFQAAFDKAFAKALAREARAVLGKKTPPAKIEEIVRAIRAGVTDPATALVDHFAKEAGFNPATPTQHKRLVELDQIVADRDLSLPERHIAIGEMNGIFRQMKLPPTVMTKLSANFVATLLTGLRTLTVNIFAPATHLLTERVLLSATNPRDLLTHWKALAGGWSNWLREAQFTATEDVMTYLNDDFRGATNVLKRMWEDGVRDMRSGNPKQQAKGLWQLLSGSQQYAMRMLNAADQANMRAESEAMLVLYGSDVLRQAGFGTKEVEMMVKAVPRIKNELIQQGLDQGMSPKLARVRADSLLAEKLREFIKDDISELAGDEFSQAVNAAELEGYNITGRLGIETDTRDPLKETDEGGMLSRLILHHVLEWSSKMRSKPGSGPAVAVALLGYLNVPLRTARFYAWNSGYGLIRLGIHAFRKRQGWDNWWKQSLSNELQERHRLKMAVAATVAQAIIVGVGFALLKGSDDDDAGEDKLGVYVTGDGPKNKNLKDAWTRRGFQAQSIVMFVAGKPIRVPLTRLGEPLAHIFWPLSALDDWRWRKKEAEASGRPFAEPPSETVMRSIGTYAGLLGQRGPLQSVTQWAKVGSGEGGTAKILAQQTSRVVSAAVTPWLGLQSSASAMIYGPIDQTSISAAIYASMPILGLFGERFRKQQVNRFGDPLYDQSWYAKMSQTGVPIAFRVANTPENQKVYSLLTEKGAAPPVLRRYILEERFGPLTNKQFEQFSETSGRRLKQEVSSNQAALRDMSPEAAKNWLNKTTTRVDRQTELDMGLQRVKPLKVSGGGGYSILGAASTPRTVGGTIGRSRSRPVSFGRSRRRRTSLRGYSTRGRSRIRRPRLARIGRSRVRRARLYASRVRRPRLSFA